MFLHLGAFPIIPALGMFVTMLLFLEIGRRIGVHRLEVPGARAGVGVVDGSVYALVALLIGFSFNGAAARFDSRRALIGATTNVAGTAWQRVDMLPPELQPPIRDAMRRYLDALINSYAHPTLDDASLRADPAVSAAQNDLWTKAATVCSTPAGEKARMLLLPSLNDLFGAVEQERLARELHPPRMIYLLLALATWIGAIFVGYAIATPNRRNLLYMFGIAGTLASATYVIAELEYPRLGGINVDAIDRTLVDLRASMR